MDKDRLLYALAENGYNVVFGARKHFATYDIIEKIPGIFAFFGLIIGVWQIYYPTFKYNTEVSLVLIFLSIIALYIDPYKSSKEGYKDRGEKLIQLHNQLRQLYYSVKSKSVNDSFIQEESEMNQILTQYNTGNIANQILFSDWYAHYKLFAKSQYDWIDEQKHFKFRDKFPLSFRFFAFIVIIGILLLYVYRYL
ncbi:SLATT domain-containing protein [Paenibacillus spiritus]|uniref:SLATT domain-containing protein n=1 Tax=Paenibacillus spiritus TaxID=2496557 RepID=A0A5J5GBH3_9BACL|nr:SLATT domain-containing protein [Paenibacillus spiritus]KAA9005479.1 SLATT domain-containing protein [Paenibacillus spiritus]